MMDACKSLSWHVFETPPVKVYVGFCFWIAWGGANWCMLLYRLEIGCGVYCCMSEVRVGC